ncbi:sugar phosphate isomerase/epimerase family protein [Brachybacterium hainanense]|uniref:Sugar phosphate isomerase/epimerase family protein n=1 Tax=Brachybacterium hainanense TaxID=1541174 RepID=A0ABV6R8I0_9MICO
MPAPSGGIQGAAEPRIGRRLLASCWTWAGDVGPGSADERSPVPLDRRIAAIAASGWNGVGLSHPDLRAYTASPGLDALRRRLADAGIDRIEVEFLEDWWQSGPRKDASDRVRGELLEAAAQLGARALKVGAPARTPLRDQPSGQRLIDAFGELAEAAAPHDVDVALEPMSHTVLPTLPDAIDLVRSVGNPRAGLAVDAFQLARSGEGFEDLPALLDGVPVHVVELGDAVIDAALAARAREGHGLAERSLPGHGDLDVAGFVLAMHEAGWRGDWGVEIISSRLRALPVEDGVRQVHEGSARILEEAERRLARRA